MVSCVLLSFEAQAQSPKDGKIEGDAYVNSYFHISYEWAKLLQPDDIASLVMPQQSANSNEFLLFSARQGDEPYGVVLVTEKLNVRAAHSGEIRDAADMLNRILHFSPEQHVTILAKKHFTSASGFAFDEVDYTEDGGYSAAMLTPVENFLLVFKCNARSGADLAQMTASVAALERTQSAETRRKQ